MATGKEKLPRDQNEMWNLAEDFRERGFGTSFIYNFGYNTTQESRAKKERSKVYKQQTMATAPICSVLYILHQRQSKVLMIFGNKS